MTDPTQEAPPERGAMPSVAVPRRGLSNGVIAIGAVAAGALLFTALEARRQSRSAPAVAPTRSELRGTEQIPPLYIPPAPPPVEAYPTPIAAPPPPSPAPSPIAQTPLPSMPITPAPFVPQADRGPERPARSGGGATIVMDNSQASQPGTAGSGDSGVAAGQDAPGASGRARAGAIANRSTTVPQGTLIPAVLETAFNSSRAGFARALVQRDVHGFDGRRILIPRGSRLIGEYQSNTAQGQKRALINWTRLIRPDGATIALASPVADSLGAGGVRAKVNTHFLERFSGAILQSALDVGVNLASRSTGNPVIVALPGAIQGQSGQIVRQADIPPTLSIRQGTSVSVFVARDLDFTDVESRQ